MLGDPPPGTDPSAGEADDCLHSELLSLMEQVEESFLRILYKRAAGHWGSRRYDWFQNKQQGIAI